ncbi:MAG: geranylgeranyl reductase family protein [Candidatus Thermoplasmatota archaeon]|nr:geranylgeranyl reductase family protein [Candidatus Thermoplasmatota archaeon]|tara:strand:- start:174 stop:1379 length:1206 start_codon:yes stop_codon:yes gene_type:complete
MVRYFDAIVVGAGPIGGYLCKKLNVLGHSVLLLEEHDEIGRPFQCAGLVNPAAMKTIGLEDSILTTIWGANIHSPRGRRVSIGDPEVPRTFSVCRKIFDEAVVMQSIDSGTEIMLSTKPISAKIENEYVEVNIDGAYGAEAVRCKLLCGADGAHSWVRRKFKMGSPTETMIGFQIEVTGYSGNEGMLDMYTGSGIAPGFFSWAIPTGETTRLGTWTKSNLMGGISSEDFMSRLMEDPALNSRFAECSEVGRFCGPVPSGIVRRPMRERVALFGDAAGICKPTTGGGIGPGFKQVDLLVPALSQAIHDNDLSDTRMKSISSKLKEMKRGQRKKRALRDAFLTEMDDIELESIFAVWARPEVTAIINEFGDIENPIPLGIKMLREVPEFRRLAGRAAKAILWS